MTIALEALRIPPTRTEMLDVLLAHLSSLGFQTTSWQSGSIQRTLLTGCAALGADVATLDSKLANFGFNTYSTGAPLREYARSSYDNEPQPAQKTIGPVTLTNTGASSYTIGVGQLLVASATGVEFNNTTGGTLNPGSTLSLTFSALLAGSAGNVPNLAITKLLTPLAGVTVSNPDNGTGVWYTTSGADQETTTKIRERNTTKWRTLNQIAMPGDGYKYLALSVPPITKVYVDDQNPRGPYTLDVYIATANGPATGSEITAVQTLLNIKRGPATNVLVKAPSNKPINITATIHIQASLNTAAKRAAIEAAGDAFIQALPMGGIILPPSTTRIIPKSELIGAYTAVKGVVGVSVSIPVSDVDMTPIDLATVGVKALTFLSA
jgi:uncharacterized phage protein gp47/JayE